MDITKDGAIARAKAVAGFSVNAVHHITQDDWAALGHALLGIERTLGELREYWETKEETPPRFNMFAIRVTHDDDVEERGSEG
jgi:hypothetical protein